MTIEYAAQEFAISIRNNITNWLQYAVAISLLLTCSAYYVIENGSANSFPTYLAALSLLPLLALHIPDRVDWPLAALVAAFLAFMAISVAWADSGESVLNHLGKGLLVLVFALGIAVSCQRFGSFLPWLMWLIVAAGVINALVSIYLHFRFPDYQPLPEARLFALGRLSNPVVSALSYGVVVVIVLHILLNATQRWAQVVAAVSLPVLVYAIVLTWSRGVWLALAASLTVGLMIQYRDNRKWQALGIIGALAVLGAAAYLFLGPELLFKRALSFRPEIWSEFVGRTLESNLLIGVGLTSASDLQLPELLIKHPHSVFVSTFYYGGMIGLLLYLAVLARTVLNLVSMQQREVQQLAAMLLAFGVTATFLDGNELLTKVNYLWLLIWLPVGLALARHAIGDNEVSDTK